MRALRLAVLAALGVAMSSLPKLFPAQAAERRSVLVTEPDGQKVYIVFWAVDRPDNIVTLRIPAGYASLWAMRGQVVLGRYDQDEDGENRNSEISFYFSALLPDLRPRTKNNLDEFTRPGGGDEVSGSITSAVAEGNPQRERDQLLILLEIDRKIFVDFRGPNPTRLDIDEKPDRFGLRRIGPRRLSGNLDRYRNLNDLYFIGTSPEKGSFYIRCDADEVTSREDDPMVRRVAHCSHTTTIPELSAVLSFDYQGVFLNDWEKIQSDVKALILSSKQP